MPIANRLQQYLGSQGIEFDVLPHRHTATSSDTAKTTHISGDRIAKAVVLKDGAGFLLAVVPASHHVRRDQLKAWLGRELGMATEAEASALFADCEAGAFPAIGAAYGVDVVVDDALRGRPEVYLEAGDHASLLHLKGSQFDRLMASAPHGAFSRHD